MLNEEKIKELEKISWQLRSTILEMFSYGKAHHFGGSLSCVELLASLYFYKMNYNKNNFSAPDRDRFIMSKGHSVPTQYAVLAKLGIIPEDKLLSIKQLGSTLQGHPDINKTEGIEAPTGSLGQGLSYANGIALSSVFDKQDFRVYVMLGDGELQEGQLWEAAMTTSQYSLNNLTVIVDSNKYQSQGSIREIMNIEPLEAKFEAFGWQTARIDGHNIKSICEALDAAESCTDRPSAIIADTIKGKGISFIEDSYKYHNYSLTQQQFDQAHDEIAARLRNFGE